MVSKNIFYSTPSLYCSPKSLNITSSNLLLIIINRPLVYASSSNSTEFCLQVACYEHFQQPRAETSFQVYQSLSICYYYSTVQLPYGYFIKCLFYVLRNVAYIISRFSKDYFNTGTRLFSLDISILMYFL